MKLTQVQQEIVDGMKNGQEFVKIESFRGDDYYRLGLKHVNANTAKSLIKKGVIKALPVKIGRFRTIYQLVDQE